MYCDKGLGIERSQRLFKGREGWMILRGLEVQRGPMIATLRSTESGSDSAREHGTETVDLLQEMEFEGTYDGARERRA